MDVESCIVANVAWQQLPEDIKTILGNSQKEYDKMILEYSVRNQLRHKGNLVRFIKKDREQYYDMVMKYSESHLMLFPYHLADIIIKHLRITPFNYYIQIIMDMINSEKSYDSLPNFTAADAMRLLGIGRNQYIELMNQNRSNRRLFRRSRPLRELLPSQPVQVNIEPWWVVDTGSILENDVKGLSAEEKRVIDQLLDEGPSPTQRRRLVAGLLDMKIVHSLFHRGLVYFDVPVDNNDYVFVGPLDGFVMNRVLGDYFETLLYKIFVTIDDETKVAEIADILHIDLQLVKNAVSVFCRLGFAKKRITGLEQTSLHPSWISSPSTSFSSSVLPPAPSSLPKEISADFDDFTKSLTSPGGDEDEVDESSMSTIPSPNTQVPSVTSDVSSGGRTAFVFDSTLTAFLMMGNLSTSLKGHAVTLFEVGKLTDEQMKDFMDQLDNVNRFGEGEARRYSEHAIALLHTLRNLKQGRELDMVRGESLLSLDAQSRTRILHKAYGILVAMAPLSVDACAIPMSSLPFLGPPIPEVVSPWLRLAIYSLTSCGPPTAFYSKGTRLREMPRVLSRSKRYLVSSPNHEPQLLSAYSALVPINDLLLTTPLAVQEFYSPNMDNFVFYVPFPFGDELDDPRSLANHPAIVCLRERLSLGSLCGYVILVQQSGLPEESPEDEEEPSSYAAAAAIAFGSAKKKCQRISILPDGLNFSDFVLFDCVFGIPLFDEELNETICTRMKEQNTLSVDNRVNIQFANKALVDLITDIISQYNYGVTSSPFPDGIEIVPPVRTLTFDPSLPGIVAFEPFDD